MMVTIMRMMEVATPSLIITIVGCEEGATHICCSIHITVYSCNS